MGVVWSGVHAAQRVPVAVKVLMGEGARDPVFLEWFRNEVRAAASLDHPAIALVLDHGQIDAAASAASEGRLVAGSPYLAMELVGGGSLSPYCGRLEWPDLRAVLSQLLDALAHAHARGVVHRDLKASNILLANGPADLRLVDFGLAHLAGRADADESRVAGTPAYMAPEQFEAQWRDYGPWTDLYAAGCLAFALATGEPPFGRRGSIQKLQRAHLNRPPPPLRARTAVAAGFEAWLSRLLEKDPSARFRSAADALFALEALEREPTVPPSPFGAPTEGGSDAETQASPSRRRRTRRSLEEATRVDAPSGDPRDATTRRGLAPLKSGARASPAEPPSPVAAPPQPDDWRRPPRERPASLAGAGLGLYGLRPVPLVDRERERELLWRALFEVRRSSLPQAVVLRGPTGCGKSRLAEWLCERALETGAAHVLRAVHSPVAGALDGLAPMLGRAFVTDGLPRPEVMHRVAAALRAQGCTDASEIVALTELLSPATPAQLAQGAPVVRFASATERFALIARHLSRVAEDRPVIVWLDDVQWGLDALEFGNHLLAAGPAKVLLVLTAREEELAARPAEAQALSRLGGIAGASSIDVGPLGVDDRRTLVRELLGLDGALAEQVEARTAGNPLFAVQLVGDWVQRGVLEPGARGFRLKEGARADLPEDLGKVWARRLDAVLERRSLEEIAALELAAVLGQDVDGAEWREACTRAGLLPPLSLVEELLMSRLARAGSRGPSEGFSFVHGALREVLEQRAAAAGRVSGHHALCAAMLEEKSGRGILERLSRHLLASGKLAEALQPLLGAARERLTTGDLGLAESILEDRRRALDALGLAPTDARRGWNDLVLAEILERRGDASQALPLVDRAHRLGTAEADAELRAHALAAIGRLKRRSGDLRGALATLRGAERLAGRIGARQLRASCQRFLGRLRGDRGELEAAANAYRAGIAEFLRLGDDEGAGHCFWGLGTIDRKAGRLTEAESNIVTARLHLERCGSRHGVALCLNLLGELARFQGELDRAEGFYRQAMALFASLGAVDARVVEHNLGLVLIQRGEYLKARPALEAVAAQFDRDGRKMLAASVHASLLSCAAAAKDWAAFDEHLERVLSLESATGFVDVDIAAMASLGGELALESGELARAERALRVAIAQWRALKRDDEARRAEEKLARPTG